MEQFLGTMAWSAARAAHSNAPQSNPGDTSFHDMIMDEPIEWDACSYPPMDAPQNMNALIESWGEGGDSTNIMAVSECELSS